MSDVTRMLIILGIAMFLIIFLIMKVRLAAFLALTFSAMFLGIASGMPLDKIAVSFQTGMGNTLGFLATVLGLGTILGKMLEVSGGAQCLAKTLVNVFGKKRAHWAMMVVAFICGIPVLFQVGFVLLLPVMFSIAKQAKMSLIKIAIPVVTALMVVHAMIPPHPAALAVTGVLNANVGAVILIGLIVGLPAAIIGGPIYGNFISKRVKVDPPSNLFNVELIPEENLPGFGITLFTILLPMFIMIAKTIVALNAPEGASYIPLISFVGNPIVALFISVICSYFTLGFSRGMKKEEILKLTESCFGVVAGILLIIGAGGAFNQILQDSGMGKMLAGVFVSMNMNPIFLAWMMTIIMRAAIGSTTVVMMASAGIMLPILSNFPNVNPAIICIAIGAGGIGLSHVNDSGFWLVKEYFGMTIGDTLKSWTAGTTLASVVALVGTLIVGTFI